MKRNLLLGTIVNYNWEKVEAFFKSYKQAAFLNCECVMFVSNLTDDTLANLRKYGVQVINIPADILTRENHINDVRYHLFADFLGTHLDSYNMVLSVDVRDIIFQKDVFQYPWKPDAIGVAYETEKIGYEVYNRAFMEHKYGTAVLNQLKEKYIICGGTVLARADIMLKLCRTMDEEIFQTGYIPKSDQAVLDYVLYTGKLGADIQPSDVNGPIVTVGDKNIRLKIDRHYIYNGNNAVAYLVHQYDRHTKLRRFVKVMYLEKYAWMKKLRFLGDFYIAACWKHQ